MSGAGGAESNTTSDNTEDDILAKTDLLPETVNNSGHANSEKQTIVDKLAPLKLDTPLTAPNECQQLEIQNEYHLTCGNSSFRVSKDAMEKHSGYVRALQSFSKRLNEMSDSPTMDNDNDTLNLDVLDVDALRCVVEYVSCANVTLKMDTVPSIIRAADFLDMPMFLEFIGSYITSQLTHTNCVDVLNIYILEFQSLLQLDKVFDCIRSYIRNNISDISMTQLNSLSKKELLSFTCDDNLRICNEWVLVKIVIDWMYENTGIDIYVTQYDHDKNTEDDAWVTFTELMSRIRWSVLPEYQMRATGIISAMDKIPKCRSLMEEARYYCANIHKQPFIQTFRSTPRCTHPCVLSLPSHNSFCVTDRNEGSLILRSLTSDKLCRLPECNLPEYRHKLNDVLSTPAFITVNNFAFICGIEYRTELHSLYFRYDPRFNQWTELSPMTISRHDHVVVYHNKRLYAIAGISEEGISQECESYDIENNVWCFIADLPEERTYHAGCVLGDSIFITGGWINSTVCNTVYRYDIIMGEWNICASLKYPRQYHVMETIGGVIYVIGGIDQNDEPVMKIEKYSPDTNQWTECDSSPELSVMDATSFVKDNKIYIVGEMERCEGNWTGSDGRRKEIPFYIDSVEGVWLQYDLHDRVCALLEVPDFWFDPGRDFTHGHAAIAAPPYPMAVPPYGITKIDTTISVAPSSQ